jgi:hypothetical protein
MTKTNGVGQRGDHGAAVFAPAISALQSELAEFERRATETKDLIKRLCARAGIAAKPPSAPPVARRKRGRPKINGDAAIDTAIKHDTAKPKAELAQIAAAVAKADRAVAAATSAKNIQALKAAIAEKWNRMREGGQLLRKLAGSVRRLPVDQVASRHMRRSAKLSAADFASKIARFQAKAIAAMGSAAPSPSPSKPKRPSEAAPAHVKNQIGKWRRDSAGAMSREIVGVVDDETTKADGQLEKT